MLNGLAGYFFGGRAADNGVSAVGQVDAPILSASPAGQAASAPANEEDGWILIDNDVELDLVALPSSTESSGSVSPVTTSEALGWNLTPPPCFAVVPQQQNGSIKTTTSATTNEDDVLSPSENNRPTSGGGGPVAKLAQQRRYNDGSLQPIEISVFENLLIEHPSMSVYHRRRSPLTSGQPPSMTSGQPTIGGGQRRQRCRWPLVLNAPLSIAQGTDDDALVALDTAQVEAQQLQQIAQYSSCSVRRLRSSVVDDFMQFFGGATCRTDVMRAATAAQQRVERAAKGRDYGTNRMRRQNNAVVNSNSHDNTADGNAKVSQPRKRRMRKHGGRSTDRKSQ